MPTAANHAPENTPFELTLPEDRTSLQRALNELLGLIAGDRISDKRATLLFRVLSLASRNLASLARNPDPVSEPQPAAVAENQLEASSTSTPLELFHQNNSCHSERSEEPPYFVRSATPHTIGDTALAAASSEPTHRPQSFLAQSTEPSLREKLMARRANLQQQATQTIQPIQTPESPDQPRPSSGPEHSAPPLAPLLEARADAPQSPTPAL
jgi:hypothetical protein